MLFRPVILLIFLQKAKVLFCLRIRLQWRRIRLTKARDHIWLPVLFM